MPFSVSIASRSWRLIIASLLVSQLFVASAQSVAVTRAAAPEEDAIGNAMLTPTDIEPTTHVSHPDLTDPNESVRFHLAMATPTPVPYRFSPDTDASNAHNDFQPASEVSLPNNTTPSSLPRNLVVESANSDGPARLQGARAIEMSESVYDALVALYNQTDGDNWFNNDGWLENRYPCSRWYGVLCMEPGVVSILLSENNLTGQIPEELSDVTYLSTLDLSFNNLTGGIPASIGRLDRLSHLNLHHNNLDGEIPPELGNLTKLVFLDLSMNDLTGTLPAELGQLTRLQRLHIYDTQIEGPIPAQLENLTGLEILDLVNNHLDGEIPAGIWRLPFLQYVNLGNNDLTGSLELDDPALEHLTDLRLYDNNLDGKIPADVGNLTSLDTFVVSNNNLTGMLPQQLVQLPLLSLYYTDTDLCAPNNVEFRNWLASIEAVGVEPCPIPATPSPYTGLNAADLETGDILFARSNYPPDIQLARLSAATYWFHSAIYIGDGQIAHATGIQDDLADHVKIDRIIDSSFWGNADTVNSGIRDWAVIRPRTTSQVKQSAAEYAAAKAAAFSPEIPYSTNFKDKESEGEFYCSKLVWKAYAVHGNDLEVNLVELMDIKQWLPREAIAQYLASVVTPDELYASAQSPLHKKSDVVQISTMEIDGVPNAVRRLSTWVLSPADLLLEDPQGRRTGYDPLTGTLYDEIPGVFYDGPDSDPEWLAFRATDEEGWTLSVTGTGEGDYLLYSYELGDESSTHQIITNTVVADQVEVFEFPPLDESGDGVLVPEADDANSSYLPLIHQ